MIFQIFGPNITVAAISGNSERFSPALIRSEVGRPGVSHSPSGRPTLESNSPSDIFSHLPEITTPVRFWPKLLENHTAVNLQKNSRGLLCDEQQSRGALTKNTLCLSVQLAAFFARLGNKHFFRNKGFCQVKPSTLYKA